MRREPYIITDNMKADEIKELIERAYDEGYKDGNANSITYPSYPINPTPYTPSDDWWNKKSITTSSNSETITTGDNKEKIR